MNRLKLSGLVSFGGAKGIGKTRFLLKLANSIANKEKVLFLSWQDCKENLSNIIHSIDGSVHPNLNINTSLNYFNVGTFLEIIEIIQKKKYTIIFIDDIENFTQNDYSDFFSEENISISKFNWSRKIINDCDQIISIG